MGHSAKPSAVALVSSMEELAQHVDYSYMNRLHTDPESTADGIDHRARQVRSGHYVPVTPSPLPEPEYVCHSRKLFNELQLDDALAHKDAFRRVFSGDLSAAPLPMHSWGWATGYALSIYGTEYTQQCPFQTGNGYGDGRAISVFEGVLGGQRWEMQLKGGGPTPYCRGADGRAVLRSSIREFLAQEHMHALGVPTSRSLTLYVSKTETVARPWYSADSDSFNPDIVMENPVAISTRVAPSFLRVGQLELFARRLRNQSHPSARAELRMIVEHLIAREYPTDIDSTLPFAQQVIALANAFSQRLTRLLAHWLRVGYCQGNFNSDNCAAGGFTLDYGPFGFCEIFDPEFQPWTGGGQHFSFFNQPTAAETNFHMFWKALRPLVEDNEQVLNQLDDIRRGFAQEMDSQVKSMWASKLGLPEFNAELFASLMRLMLRSEVDYTMFFRELSHIPQDLASLKRSFYVDTTPALDSEWQDWLSNWREQVNLGNDLSKASETMLQINPKYTWREWLIVPAYQEAMKGDYRLVRELQEVLNNPYDEQSKDIEDKYYRLKPKQFYHAGGVSHYSCSS